MNEQIAATSAEPVSRGTLEYASVNASTRSLNLCVVSGFIVLFLGALVLLIGLAVLSGARQSGGRMDEFLQMFGVAIWIFSGVCLFAGLRLIYRGSGIVNTI